MFFDIEINPKPEARHAVANFKSCITRRIHSRAEHLLEGTVRDIEAHIKSARCWYLTDSMSSEHAKTLRELLAEFSQLVANWPGHYGTAGYRAVLARNFNELWVTYEGKCLAYAKLS